MNGVLNIDKPAGITSHDVVYRVRKLAKQKRVGHAGTLDPDATGVLLVCLGHATRLSDLLAEQGKQYDAVLRLGVSTTTEDASGKVVAETDPSAITQQDLLATLPKFIGTVMQTPPMVSAVHHEGKRLYDLARQGIVVEREARAIQIDSISLLNFTPGHECSAALRVACGKGTYIRTVCADLGEILGVGGHMASLRRTRVGSFQVDNSVTLETLAENGVEAHLVISSDAISFLGAIELDDHLKAEVLNGKKINRPDGLHDGDLVRLNSGFELVALARALPDGTLQPEKVFPP